MQNLNSQSWMIWEQILWRGVDYAETISIDSLHILIYSGASQGARLESATFPIFLLAEASNLYPGRDCRVRIVTGANQGSRHEECSLFHSGMQKSHTLLAGRDF